MNETQTCRCGQWPISEYGEMCPSCPPTEFRLIMWDHREQISTAEITEAATSGYVHFTDVEDTGCDQYAVVATKTEIADATAQAAWDESVAELES